MAAALRFSAAAVNGSAKRSALFVTMPQDSPAVREASKLRLDARKGLRAVEHQRFVAVEELAFEFVITDVARRYLESLTQHAARPRAAVRPVLRQWQRLKASVCAHRIRRTRKVLCAVDQSAVEVEQHGPQVRPLRSKRLHSGRRQAIR